jgi:hypothetical protein
MDVVSAPMLKGSLILSTPGFIWGCWSNGWQVNCNPSRRLPIRSFSFPDTDHSLNSRYIILVHAPNTLEPEGPSPSPWNLTWSNSMHFTTFHTTQDILFHTRYQRANSIDYIPPTLSKIDYNITSRCSTMKLCILPPSVFICSVCWSE